ncbi:MAG: hypothetical protein JWN03_6278 [Nocardia sp.]|uniref:M20 family metallopeptidase n=1 Tax=Nocardia sp. TaxID=1821 RepID=UPI002631AA51|nr:M20/M25/M40 family metallo-hydrolase [Nocardia sp.]MCU1646003.1 hypothetical protein [Nocardia sp.]
MTAPIDRFLGSLDGLLAIDELVEIATELTAVESLTEQETPLADRVRELLHDNEIAADLQEVQPGRSQTIGWLGPEQGRPALLLNGHLDMDLPPDFGGADPYAARREGDRLYGAGLHNMKSGLAAMIAASIMVRRSGIRLKRRLLLEFVVGELQGGIGTRHALAAGLTAEAAVVPEPYSVRRVLTRTAGVYKFALVVRGRTAHTSRHAEGVDAFAVMRTLLDLFDDTDLGLRNSDFPTLPRHQHASALIGRGEDHDPASISYSASKATVLIDLRYPPPYEPLHVTAALTGFLHRARAAFPHAVIGLDHPPDPVHRVGGTDMPPMDVSPDSAVVQDISRLLPLVSEFVVEETGLALPYSYCGNDTTHLSRAGIECCLFGPRGSDSDTEHHVLISEMAACARTLAALTVLRCA